MPIEAIARFMQVLDSAFPSGSFVHSFGLEPHIVSGRVYDKESLKQYLENHIVDQYRQCEFPFVVQCYQALLAHNLKAFIRLDQQFSAMFSDTFAQASRDIGRNYLKHIEALPHHAISKDYFHAIKMQNAVGNELAVLSAYAFELGMDKALFLVMWSKKNLMSIAMCAVKISRIKPSDIQEILFELDVLLLDATKHYLPTMGNFNPLFEQTIYQHRVCEPKLFMT